MNNFDYFYGDESEQFSYYRIPRLLVTGEQFKNLSTDAKMLYGMMLDTVVFDPIHKGHGIDHKVVMDMAFLVQMGGNQHLVLISP